MVIIFRDSVFNIRQIAINGAQVVFRRPISYTGKDAHCIGNAMVDGCKDPTLWLFMWFGFFSKSFGFDDLDYSAY